MAKDKWNGVHWNDGKTTRPVAMSGEEGQPPVVSDEVLVYFEGIGFDVAVYDYEKRAWLFPNNSFKESDASPAYWKPLPTLPSDATKRITR